METLHYYEYYKYQSPLDILRKGQLIVYGYIRKYKHFYVNEIIKMIYNFYFIKILNYTIKTIGSNCDGQQGFGNYQNVKTLTTIKTYQKQIKNIINGNQNIYILFTDSTYECCGNNGDGQLGVNVDSWERTTFVKNNNIKINNIFSSPFSSHAFFIDKNNKIYICGESCNNKYKYKYKKKKYNMWIQRNTQIQIQKISTGCGYTTFINNNGQLGVCGEDSVSGTTCGVLGLGKETTNVQKIKRIPIKTKFMDIYCGGFHTLALDCNGQIWSWGNGEFGKLGHGDTNNRYTPKIIEYFLKQSINIIQICCGGWHSLVLSNKNKIYTFGNNESYQCGNNNNENVLIPELNDTLKNENIIAIKCGEFHNMARNRENKYNLWGHNEFNQCIVKSTNPPEYVKKPLLLECEHFINKYQQIIDIFLGSDSTRVLIGNTEK